MGDFEELTCRELVELVTDYLEYAMAPDDRTLFEEHLVICAACGNYVGQMQRTVEVLGVLRPEDLTPSARGALLDAFRSWRTERA